ncbi:unnamed protein product [Dicrocoelium dendriticum]|nr:unnamed protein product [Dicrocoelium dendriticum]
MIHRLSLVHRCEAHSVVLLRLSRLLLTFPNLRLRPFCSEGAIVGQAAQFFLQYSRNSRSSNSEPLDVRRSRLVYQSRKRGSLENCILLSTFADEYLDMLSPEELAAYDALINSPDNEWDIYHWATGAKEAPEAFHSDVLDLLKAHVQNKRCELRNQQPPLKFRPS